MYERVIRNYEVSIWTLQDRFLSVLKPYDVEIKGQLQEPKFTIKDDGTEEFSFSIPMYYTNARGKRIENPLWVNKTNGNLVTALRKIKIIFEKYSNNPVVYEMLITKVDEKHEGFQLVCEVACEGLAFHELGKIGYKIQLNYDEYDIDLAKYIDQNPHEQPLLNNIQYWNDKIFKINGDWKWEWTYEINMSHAMNQGKNLDSDKVYEDDYISSWNVENGEIIPTSYERGKEKCRIIDEKDSNVYNLTQKIAETFGVFCRYEYEHDPVTFQITGKKVIYYDEYLIEGEHILDITYPYDSSKISRTNDGNDITTKLFVLDPGGDNEYITIMNTDANKSGEQYILNFDYLKTIDCITPDQEEEITQFEVDIKNYNLQLQQLQAQQSAIENILNDIDNGLSAKLTSLTNAVSGDRDALARANDLLNTITNDTGEINLQERNLPRQLIKIPENENYYYVSFSEKGINADTLVLYSEWDYSNNKVNPESKITTQGQIVKNNMGFLSEVHNLPQNNNDSNFIYAFYTYQPFLEDQKVAEMWENKLKKDLIELNQVTERVENLNAQHEANSIEINTLLDEKAKRIAQFEHIMGPALREGYWQPEDDYKDYCDKQQTSINLKNLSENQGIINFSWEEANPLFNEEKEYYEYGIEQNKCYYPYIKIDDNLMSWIIAGHEDFSLVFYDTRQLDSGNISLGFRKVYTIGSRMQYAFIKDSGNLQPILLLTGIEDDDIENFTNIFSTNNKPVEYNLSSSNPLSITAKFGTTIGVHIHDNASSPTGGIISINTLDTNIEIPQKKDFYFNINATGEAQTISLTSGGEKIVYIYYYDNNNTRHTYADPRIGVITVDEEDNNLIFDDSGYSLNSNIIGQCDDNNKIYYPHIYITSLGLRTSSDELLINYNNQLRKEFEDYFVNYYKDTQNLEEVYEGYVICPKIKSFITEWFSDSAQNNELILTMNYAISNANTSIYLDALKIAKENAYPKVEYNVELNSINKDLLDKAYSLLCNIVSINDYELQLRNVLGYISEIELELDKPQEDAIKIKNYKNKFEDLFSTIVAQTGQMQKNSAVIGVATAAFDNDGKISEETISDTIRETDLDYQFNQGNLTIDNENGILASNEEGIVAIREGGIFTATRKDANDNWIWNTGITPSGINANLITTGQLDTNRLRIYAGDNLRLQMNGDGLFAYKKYDTNLSNKILPPSNSTSFAGADLSQYVKFDENGLKLIAERGARINKNNTTTSLQQDVERVSISWDGLKLRNYNNDVVFEADADTGDLKITGDIHATSGSFTGEVTATSGSFTGDIFANSFQLKTNPTASNYTTIDSYVNEKISSAARGIEISSDGEVFIIDANNNDTISPSIITLTANLKGLNSADGHWYYKNGNSYTQISNNTSTTLEVSGSNNNYWNNNIATFKYVNDSYQDIKSLYKINSGKNGVDGKSVQIKGSKASADELDDIVDKNIGDGYLIQGNLYVWDGTNWQNVGQIKGDQGAKGDDGRSLQSLVNYYKYTNSASSYGDMPTFNGENINQSNGWTSSIPSYSSDNPYLWNFERIIYANPAGYVNTTPVRINGIDGTNGTNGTNGAPGRGIVRIEEWYLTNNSTTAPEYTNNSWAATIQAPDKDNPYLWNYEAIYYTDTNNNPQRTERRIISYYTESPTVYELQVSEPVIIKDRNGNYNVNTIQLSATSKIGNNPPQSCSSCTYEVSTNNGITKDTISPNGYTIPENAEKLIFYLFVNEVEVDSQTIYVIGDGAPGQNGAAGAAGQNGTSPYNLIITNENMTFAEGTSASNQSLVYVYKGINSQTVSISGLNSNSQNVTATSQNNTITVEANADATGSGQITFTVTADEQSFNGQISWSVAQKGATGENGEDGYTVFLTNENHTFPADVNGILSNSSITTDVKIYEGIYLVDPGTTSNPNINVTLPILSQNSGFTISSAYIQENNNNILRITISSTGNQVQALNGTFDFTITYNNINFVRTFSYQIAKDGNTITSTTKLYYLATAQNGIITAPNAPRVQIESTSTSANQWTTVLPILSTNNSNIYEYYTCDQYTWANGVYSWSEPTIDRPSTVASLIDFNGIRGPGTLQVGDSTIIEYGLALGNTGGDKDLPLLIASNSGIIITAPQNTAQTDGAQYLNSETSLEGRIPAIVLNHEGITLQSNNDNYLKIDSTGINLGSNGNLIMSANGLINITSINADSQMCFGELENNEPALVIGGISGSIKCQTLTTDELIVNGSGLSSIFGKALLKKNGQVISNDSYPPIENIYISTGNNIIPNEFNEYDENNSILIPGRSLWIEQGPYYSFTKTTASAHEVSKAVSGVKVVDNTSTSGYGSTYRFAICYDLGETITITQNTNIDFTVNVTNNAPLTATFYDTILKYEILQSKPSTVNAARVENSLPEFIINTGTGTSENPKNVSQQAIYKGVYNISPQATITGRYITVYGKLGVWGPGAIINPQTNERAKLTSNVGTSSFSTTYTATEAAGETTYTSSKVFECKVYYITDDVYYTPIPKS